jgi:hypothetical protein
VRGIRECGLPGEFGEYLVTGGVEAVRKGVGS